MSKTLIKPTLMDRLVNWVNPVAGSERYKARAMQASVGAYTGAARKRSFANWFARGGSADADLNPDLATLRNRSRDLYRNDGLARGAVSGMVSNVVGSGLAPQPAIWASVLGLDDQDADDWQRQTLREFTLWAEDAEQCDLTATQNFYSLQDLCFRSVLINGDHFVLQAHRPKTGQAYGLKLQMIEADRVCNPNGRPDTAQLSAGVELDAEGAPQAYQVMARHPGGVTSKPVWQKIARRGETTGRRNVLHLFDRQRAEQRRGEPFLAPVIESLKQLSRYTEAELMAAVISGMFTVFVTVDPESGDDGDSSDDYALGNGAVVVGNPGEKPEVINPGRPNALFDPFVLAILRQIGVALEIPYEVLIKHFTSSYSAARAALLDAWRLYKKRRAWLAAVLCQPVYETWLDEAVSSGRIQAPGYFADPLIQRAWRNCVWVGDAPGAIDPYKEAQADQLNLQIGKTTLAKVTMGFDGSNWEDNHRQQVREQRARQRDGLSAAANPAPPAPPEPPDLNEDSPEPAERGLF